MMTAINFRFSESPPHVVGVFDLVLDVNGAVTTDCRLCSTTGPYWVKFPPPADRSVWSSTIDYFRRTAKMSFQQLATRAAVAAMHEAGARKGTANGASASG
jgi:hypothetical protein